MPLTVWSPRYAARRGVEEVVCRLLLLWMCFHQVFEKLRCVFVHIDARASAAIAAVAAHRGIDHGLLAALRVARFRVKIGGVIDEELHRGVPSPASRFVKRRLS